MYVSSNFFFTTTNYVTTDAIFDLTNSWTYTTNDLDGVNWTATNYDDSAWAGSGPGLLWTDVRGPNAGIPSSGHRNAFGPGHRLSVHHLLFPNPFPLYEHSSPALALLLTTYIDDGAVFYLNGAELYRLRMPASPAVISNSTLASGYPCSGDATCPDLFALSGGPVTNLVLGDNVLAVEVHNYNARSPDITFGIRLGCNRAARVSAAIGHCFHQPISSRSTGAAADSYCNRPARLPGPWTNVAGPVVSSPFTWTNPAPSEFFRLWR